MPKGTIWCEGLKGAPPFEHYVVRFETDTGFGARACYSPLAGMCSRGYDFWSSLAPWVAALTDLEADEGKARPTAGARRRRL